MRHKMALSQTDREKIDGMSLKDMQAIWDSTPGFVWPFKDFETGEYFIERFSRLEQQENGDDDKGVPD